MSDSAKMTVRDLRLWYGSKEALKGIQLDIPKHKIVALIGPSGCGKSTLLRAMNRMHDLTPEARITGDISVDGYNIYAPAVDAVEVRRRVGMVFQKPNPFPKSIFENVAYGLRINGEKNRQRLQQVVEKTLKSSYLWEEVKDNLDKSALSLSGGSSSACVLRGR